jgi:hypothetical protein
MHDPRLEDLERFIHVWEMSDADAAAALGVGDAALRAWRRKGVPQTHHSAIQQLSAMTNMLETRVRPERIPDIVRRPADILAGASLRDVVREGRISDAIAGLARMFDLGRIRP